MRPSSQRYELSSTWLIAAPVDRCWTFLTSPDQRWRDWWRGLERIDVDRTPEVVGSAATCTWRAPVGYRVRFRLHLTAAKEAEEVVLVASGDLAGIGVVRFSAAGSGEQPRGATHLHIAWDVRTTRNWMNLTAPLLAPLFRWGHDRVMRSGERGLNRALVPSMGLAP